MRLKLSALLLSTALATGFAATSATGVFAPAALAQDASVAAGEVDVDALLKLLPADAKASYESKSYDSFTGVTTVKNFKIVDPKNETQSFIAVEEIGLRGVDLAAFERVFDFSKYGATADESFKQLFGDVTVKNASMTMRGQRVGSVESLTFGGVEMKQLAFKPSGPGGQAASDDEKVKLLGAVLDALIAGPVDVSRLTLEHDGSRTSFEKLTFGGWTRGQMGPSSVTNMEVKSDEIAMKMASATGDGADFQKALPWLIKGEMPPVGPEPLLYFGANKVTGLDYDIEGTKVTIADYSIDAVNFYWLVPSSLKIGVNDLVITPAAEEGQELAELGLSKLDLDFGLDWAFDGAGGAAQLKELRIQESQLADTTLSVNLTGIDLAALVNPQTMEAAATQIGLTSARFFLKNNGGVEKFLELAAREENTTVDALKEQALQQLGQVEQGVPGADGQIQPPTDRMKSIIAALKDFINSPGTLTIRLEPPTPVTAASGMGVMFNPMGAPDALGVTVESTSK